jgi:hypothetical protein
LSAVCAQDLRPPGGAWTLHVRREVECLLVTCPETAHLEQIESDDHPLGRLILGCTRFEGQSIACSRSCAALLDRADRERTDPEIICASADHTDLKRIRPRW